MGADLNKIEYLYEKLEAYTKAIRKEIQEEYNKCDHEFEFYGQNYNIYTDKCKICGYIKETEY